MAPYRKFIFRLAGHRIGVAADTAPELDRHPLKLFAHLFSPYDFYSMEIFQRQLHFQPSPSPDLLIREEKKVPRPPAIAAMKKDQMKVPVTSAMYPPKVGARMSPIP